MKRFFPRDSSVIDLQLDHLEIQCDLAPGFWQGEAEIHDPRLCAWLESKHSLGRPGKTAIPLAMIPAGKSTFRLQPVAMNGRAKNRLEAGPIAFG